VLQTLRVTPIFSVIVATRNRRQSLSRFLDALRALPKQPAWELIVVDNASVDGTASLLSSVAEDLPILVFNEELPGKSRALNRGLQHARGEIVLFTDDDVVPDQNWLTALHRASLAYPDANVFGGRILVDYERIPRWIVNSYNLRTILTSEQDLGRDIRWFAEDQYPIGPNLAVRRRSMKHGSAVWPVNLGPGTKVPVGDERAFLMQLSHAESRDRLYIPDSIVRHQLKGRQLGFVSALTRSFLGGYAAGLLRRTVVHSRTNKGHTVATASQRLRKASSSRELICMAARAIGVLTGTTIPFTRILHG